MVIIIILAEEKDLCFQNISKCSFSHTSPYYYQNWSNGESLFNSKSYRIDLHNHYSNTTTERECVRFLLYYMQTFVLYNIILKM